MIKNVVVCLVSGVAIAAVGYFVYVGALVSFLLNETSESRCVHD